MVDNAPRLDLPQGPRREGGSRANRLLQRLTPAAAEVSDFLSTLTGSTKDAACTKHISWIDTTACPPHRNLREGGIDRKVSFYPFGSRGVVPAVETRRKLHGALVCAIQYGRNWLLDVTSTPVSYGLHPGADPRQCCCQLLLCKLKSRFPSRGYG